MLVALIKGLRARARTEGLRPATACNAVDKALLFDAWSASNQYTRLSFLPDCQGV